MYHYLYGQDAMSRWQGDLLPPWLQPLRRPMDRLPWSVKELIVKHVVWGQDPPRPEHERWKDGKLQVKLFHGHPLVHFSLLSLQRQGMAGSFKATTGEMSIRALMLVSRVFKQICDRIIQEMWPVSPSACWILPCICPGIAPGEWCGGCDPTYAIPEVYLDGHPDPDRVTTALLAAVSNMAAKVIQDGRLQCPTRLILQLRLCSNVTVLDLCKETLTWLSDILEVLLMNGGKLEQLGMRCLHTLLPSRSFANLLEDSAALLRRFPNLRIISFEDRWWEELENVHDHSGVSEWVLGTLPRSVEYLQLSGLRGDQITPERALPLFQSWSEPKTASLTRLSILKIVNDKASLVRRLIEAHAATLEFVAVAESMTNLFAKTTGGPVHEKDRLLFLKLYHLSLDINLGQTRMIRSPDVLPTQWHTPCLRHLTSNTIQLSKSCTIFTIRRSLATLARLAFVRLSLFDNEGEDGSHWVETGLAASQLAIDLQLSHVQASISMLH